MKTLRIGSGAGYSGDRIEPAVELARFGNLDYLVFECLAERTIALAQQEKAQDATLGFDPLLRERMRAVLAPCRERGVRIITNMGAANPLGAARAVVEVARALGITGLRVAAVVGDDVADVILAEDRPLLDGAGRTADLTDRLVSANAYLGAGPIVEALAGGADIVITGRVGDPAMFLAPMIHEFGWDLQQWERLGRGTLVGHMLECAGQVTGGYFADPGHKDVANLARLGFPLAEVDAEGFAVITKVAGSGGEVTIATCKEQLLYEVHDPARYLQPDVIADFSGVMLEQTGPDRVALSGATGHAATGLLKVSIGYRDSWIGEGQISYAGSGARARAELALRIVEERLALTQVETCELRFEMIGVDSVFRSRDVRNHEATEIRIRVAGRTDSRAEAIRIGNEVETLYTCGPAGGGGVTKSAREIIAVASTLIPAALARPRVEWVIGQ